LSSNLTRLVLVLEYKGTGYCGFQYQDNAPTIQDEIEKALLKLTGENIRVVAASRTDSGVHAAGQVISFRTRSSIPTGGFIRGINHFLPMDIAVKASYRVKAEFNVQRDAVSRRYSYRILNSPTPSPLKSEFTYQVSSRLDVEAMNEACRRLIGEHDLTSFVTGFSRSVIRSPLRTVYEARVEKRRNLVVLEMVAGSFLPHQVRNTAGTLIRVGLGKINIDDFQTIMEAKKPGLAGPTLPARGLCLIQVDYPRPLENYDEDLQC
jgi:tRNA pseudouridine38-40 synthase